MVVVLCVCVRGLSFAIPIFLEINIKSEVASQGGYSWVYLKKGNLYPEKFCYLCFSKIPEFIWVRFLCLLFIPSPLHCFNFQCYGHGASFCKSPAHCFCYSGTGHAAADCSNCKLWQIAHSLVKRQHKWKEADTILDIHVESDGSDADARQRIVSGLLPTQ